MPETARKDAPIPNTVGHGIRRHRTARGWALKDLSQASGVPLSTLSKVETGAMSLKIEKLLDVCGALGIDVMDLVAPDAAPVGDTATVTGRRAITRTDEAPETATANTVYRHHAHDFANRRMTPSEILLQPGHEPDLVRHRGEEFIYVLEGRVEVLTEFYTPTVLEAGDSIYIDANMAHNVRALDDRPARVLNIAATRAS